MIKSFIRSNKKAILLAGIGAVAGGLAGFFYWKYIGCVSGTCAIWTNPTRSTLYGSLLGALLLSSFAPGASKKSTD